MLNIKLHNTKTILKSTNLAIPAKNDEICCFKNFYKVNRAVMVLLSSTATIRIKL